MSREHLVTVNSEKILKELDEQGITQKELAERMMRNGSRGYNYIGVHRAIHAGKMTESMLDEICKLLDIAPEYVRDLTEGLNWLVGEEVRLDYMYHIQQGANFNRGMNEILKANYINPAKMTKRQYNDAVELFWNAAEQVRKNIEESRSKESQ